MFYRTKLFVLVCLLLVWYINCVLDSRSLDHPNIIEGHGTIGLEILDQTENLDAVVIPVGGGGLITGIATVIKKLKPDILVYVSYTINFCYYWLRFSGKYFMDFFSWIFLFYFNNFKGGKKTWELLFDAVCNL